jgi:hypothetical protein
VAIGSVNRDCLPTLQQAEAETPRKHDCFQGRPEPPRSVLGVQRETGEPTFAACAHDVDGYPGARRVVALELRVQRGLWLGARRFLVVAELKEQVADGTLRLVLDLHDRALVERHLESADKCASRDHEARGDQPARFPEARAEEVPERGFDARAALAIPVDAQDRVLEHVPLPDERHGHPEADNPAGALQSADSQRLAATDVDLLVRPAVTLRPAGDELISAGVRNRRGRHCRATAITMPSTSPGRNEPGIATVRR